MSCCNKGKNLLFSTLQISATDARRFLWMPRLFFHMPGIPRSAYHFVFSIIQNKHINRHEILPDNTL